LAGPVLLVVAALAALVLAAVAYLYAGRLVLRISHARPVTPDEEPRYHNLVEGLCVSAGLPKPELYVVDDDAPNSFATGRDPGHGPPVDLLPPRRGGGSHPPGGADRRTPRHVTSIRTAADPLLNNKGVIYSRDAQPYRPGRPRCRLADVCRL